MARSTGRLLVLIGSSRSGKSTWAKQWQQTPENKNKVIVNADNIRLALHGERYNKLCENFVHSITEVMVRALFIQGMYICIDETSSTISSIRKWLQIDPDAEVHFQDTAIEICKQRAYDSSQPDLVEKGVIDRHFGNLIKLTQYGYDLQSDDIYQRTGYYECDNKEWDIPSKEYILLAVEYIRKEVKEGLINA